jgi:Chromate transport protein ChrA
MIYLQLFWEFAKVGLFTVGGGMAAFPFLLSLSEKTGWFTQAQLVDMVAISESTPGPIGINMATFAGYLTAGVPGALIATLGMVFPTVILVLIVAKFLQTFRNNKYVLGAMYGLRPASAGLIAAAGLSVALLSLVDTAAFKAHQWTYVVDIKTVILAAVLLVLTNNVKKTKGLHPVVFLAASAIIGIVFKLAGA